MPARIRNEIIQLKKDLNISDENMKEVGLTEWKSVQDKIFSTFFNFIPAKEIPSWLWQHFKQDTISASKKHSPFDLTEKLIDPKEKIWFFVNETINEQTKFWHYEGSAKSIHTIIMESLFIDEVYLCSKKYKWLLCINHHDELIVCGKELIEKLNTL